MKKYAVLSEALRLLFPMAALNAALFVPVWILVGSYDLPFLRDVPASQWHAYEMIFGVFGMALTGFLATAVPEWTDTKRIADRELLLLASLWLPGRLTGLLGLETLSVVAAITDLLLFLLLACYLCRAFVMRKSWANASFAFWLLPLAASGTAVRYAWHMGEFSLSERLLEVSLCLLVVFFSLSASRIIVPVINRALDPSGDTVPYRPHPGRRHVAASLTAIYSVSIILWPNSEMPGWLALAAGAAFMDRMAEWFVGRKAFKTEVLALGLANAFAGVGFLVLGLARTSGLTAPSTGLHMIGAGGLGMATIAVFVIAGTLHTGRSLTRLPWHAHTAVYLMASAVIVRTAPELLALSWAYSGYHGAAALLWSGAFCIWLYGFLPYLVTPSVKS